MSIIQKIRDKAAWLVFGLIALSLVGFLLMDAFVGRSRMFGGNSTTVGSVNGEKLDYVKFQRQVTEREDQYKAQGLPMSEMMQQNIKDAVWKEFVDDVVIDKVVDKTGITVSDRELNDMLVGPNAIPEIRRSFTDPKTGVFDGKAAENAINQLRTIYLGNKKNDQNYEQARRFFEEGLPQIVKQREREKYLSLIANSVYIPKWMIEKTNADNNQTANISFVNTLYSTISDSTIKVSDAEIQDYLNKHQDQYKQEESRSIAYVSFNAAPTGADSAAVKQTLLNLKTDYTNAPDIQAFFARNGTDNPYFDGYVSKSKLQVPNKDSIMALPKGAVLGPYQDGSTYVMAKMIDVKTLPDSAKARHILVATIDQQSRQPILDDSVAKKRIDSIKNLIDQGARFDTLAAKLSDDQGSKIKGGDLGWFAQGAMVKAFNDFCFDGKKGEEKVVKTEFGYHLVQIEDQKDFEPAYKVAYFAKRIEASPETDGTASGLANQFAGESRTAKLFDENATKNNQHKLFAQNVLPTDYVIQGLGDSRALVRWMYEAKLGDVSEPFNVGDKYVVAVLTEINEKGTMTVAKARQLVEPVIRNQRKADQIIKKIGSAATLDAVASATGGQVQKADSISFASPYIPNFGLEPKVVGASFDKDLVNKPVSEAIPGTMGVFVIKVENVSARANLSADLTQIRKSQEQMQQSIYQRQALDMLKKEANIKDNRGKFF